MHRIILTAAILFVILLSWCSKEIVYAGEADGGVDPIITFVVENRYYEIVTIDEFNKEHRQKLDVSDVKEDIYLFDVSADGINNPVSIYKCPRYPSDYVYYVKDRNEIKAGIFCCYHKTGDIVKIEDILKITGISTNSINDIAVDGHTENKFKDKVAFLDALVTCEPIAWDNEYSEHRSSLIINDEVIGQTDLAIDYQNRYVEWYLRRFALSEQMEEYLDKATGKMVKQVVIPILFSLLVFVIIMFGVIKIRVRR